MFGGFGFGQNCFGAGAFLPSALTDYGDLAAPASTLEGRGTVRAPSRETQPPAGVFVRHQVRITGEAVLVCRAAILTGTATCRRPRIGGVSQVIAPASRFSGAGSQDVALLVDDDEFLILEAVGAL